jgi:beta-glucosidase
LNSELKEPRYPGCHEKLGNDLNQELRFTTIHEMKIALFLGGFLFAFIVSASDTNSIYHDGPSSPSATTRQGWIDLNKNGKKDVYEDSSRPVARRVNDLLKRMTLGEKIGQLWQVNYDTTPDKTFVDKLKRGEISSFLDGSTLIETPVMRNKLQHIAVEQSRLGIPVILGHDVIHGFRTVFPIPLAQACAWEPDLFQRTQAIAAREAAAAGIDWTFAPMVDLARDPRWGRIAEGFGEDPWLGALDAAANVRGFQGTNVADPDRVVACMKHYIGYGAAEGGRDYNTTEISEFTLRNFYLPQFKAGVDAGAWTVMSAFNNLSGMPASGNRHTLTEILRGEWKFPGYVVSDWDAVNELIPHGVAAAEAGAARLGITAGVDMEMVSTTYPDTLALQVKAGRIPRSVVDEAVRRVLTVKFEKGLFDHPYVNETRCRTAFLQPDAIALAREAAAKSCVLLKNENGALPISKAAKKIALIGPLAQDAEDLVGSWASRFHASDVVSLADGIRAKLPAGAQLTVLRGCSIIEPGAEYLLRHSDDPGKITGHPTGTNEIAEATALAKDSDTVILALGEPRNWSGEDGSRSTLGLPGRQQELFDAVAATGKPVIVVLFNGRPLAVPEVHQKAAAILEAWFPGVQGGNGVADILFGDMEPVGRLTTTFPYDIGQVPIYYNHANTGRPGIGEYKGNYIDGPVAPLYPFGFGLAYTTFEFGQVQLDLSKVKMGGTVSARAQIKNTGGRTGTAVAELYIRDLACSAGARPVRELKGFQKIRLQPGESRDVEFKLSAHDLGCYDTRGNWLVEPGKYQLWIAQDSASGEPVEFELAR